MDIIIAIGSLFSLFLFAAVYIMAVLLGDLMLYTYGGDE